MGRRTLLASELERLSLGTTLLFVFGGKKYGWTVKGVLESVERHGRVATILITEIVEKRSRARPPKVGEKFTGGHKNFMLIF